jgi:hypothetical protein
LPPATRAIIEEFAQLEDRLDEFRALADDLTDWLSRKVGVTSVQPPVFPQKPASRSRFPFRRPSASMPSFEIKFVFKGQTRRFRYFIESADDMTTMKNTLRVHTNCELLVLVPDGAHKLLTNDMYYGNRSMTATVLGE